MAFNGRVLNNHPYAIRCWTGEPNMYTGNQHYFSVEGDGGVSHTDVDVDHLQAPNGQWWKVGWNLVVIERDGTVRNAKCKTTGPNKQCHS